MLSAKSRILLHLCVAVLLTISNYTFCVDSLINEQNIQPALGKTVSLPEGGVINLTFKSKIDGSLQPLLVKVPKGYTPKKKWPLLVTLHGLGDGPILAAEVESMVQIGPYGRGSVWFTGIGAQDVFEGLDIVQKLFSIDADRVYLCGFSMGAISTFNLGLKYPDIWAACVPVCGRCEDLTLIENARHLPFWVNAGKTDTLQPSKYCKRAYDRAKQLGFSQWKYTEHEMGHSFDIDWKQVGKWLLTKKRVLSPKRVSFCTKDLGSNRAYWVEVAGIEEYGKSARIDAAIEGQEINIITDNVSNYVLWLNGNLINLFEEVKIVENGVSVFRGLLNKDGCFVKTAQGGTLFKRPGLSGPLWDIYSGPCLLVYGTNSGNQSLIEAAKLCAESFSNPRWMDKVHFRITPDTAVAKKDIAENNIVLFGNAATNKLLAQISDRLPIRMSGNRIAAAGAEFSGENIGFVLIYPNPLNPDKYVSVFSGNIAETVDCFRRIWPRLHSVPKNIDFGIFEFAADGYSVNWRLKGVFGSDWHWQHSKPCREAVAQPRNQW